MLKKVLKFNAADFAVIAASGCGLFLFLQAVITTVLLLAPEPDTVPTLCSVLVPVILGFILLIFFINNLLVNFDFLLRCSVTRKQALGSVLLLLVLEGAAAVAVSLVLGQADRLIARAWVSARPELVIETFSIPLWGVALGYAGLLVLSLIGAAFLQRFGRKAFWVLWAGWMVIAFGINLVDWDALGESLNLYSGSLPLAAVPIALALLAAGVWSVRQLLRATVKS